MCSARCVATRVFARLILSLCLAAAASACEVRGQLLPDADVLDLPDASDWPDGAALDLDSSLDADDASAWGADDAASGDGGSDDGGPPGDGSFTGADAGGS